MLRRSLWLLLFVASSAVLLAARWVVPSPTGLGTHEQLGLPPCGFLLLAGLPCPACGLTTSFAHMARLDLGAALHAHPVGPLMFALCVLLVPLSLRASTQADSLIGFIERTQADRVSLWVACALLAAWVGRLLA